MYIKIVFNLGDAMKDNFCLIVHKISMVDHSEFGVQGEK